MTSSQQQLIQISRPFISSTVKKRSQQYQARKKSLSRPTQTQSCKHYNQPLSSVFNRSFFIREASQQKTRTKTQKSQQPQTQDQKKALQKVCNEAVSPQYFPSYIQPIKPRALTFQYYFKHKNYSKKKQRTKTEEPNQPYHHNNGQSNSSLLVNKQLVSNFNQQTMECMRSYIKKGEKAMGNDIVECTRTLKTDVDTQLENSLDIKAKGIQTRKRDYRQEFENRKKQKKFSLGALGLQKQVNLTDPQESLSNKSPQQSELSLDKKVSQTSIVKQKRIVAIQSILCKRRSPSQNFPTYQNQSLSTKEITNPSQPQYLLLRFQTMTFNLNLILASFDCQIVKQKGQSGGNSIITTQIKQKSKDNLAKRKFMYFVGFGNNRNLIRSIMKKRWWWAETENIKEANFVWTQIKINSILDQVQDHCKQLNSFENLKDIENLRETNSTQDSNNQTLTSSPQIKICKPTLQTLKSFQISLKKSSKSSKHKLLSSLLTKQNSHKLSQIFHKNYQFTKLQFLLTKSPKSQHSFRQLKTPKKVHNHYRHNYMFGNKNALFHNLKAYFDFINKPQQLFQLIPKTYYLQKSNKPALKHFHLTQFSTLPKNSPHKPIWILKPAQNSNRGQGISVHTSFESIRKQILTNRHNAKFIVQSYIKNLFLYQRRKFDIRTYMIAVTVGQKTCFYWYNEGYLRTSSQYYSVSDVDNLFVHLTNDAIQCDAESYGKFQPGNKLSYAHFQRYLDLSYPRQKYSMQQLNSTMKTIAQLAVKAIYPKIKSESTQYSFQLFGLDFLIDSNFKPYLIQINTNPCLQLGCPVLERLIPRMLENMFRLCLDPLYQPFQQLTKMSSYFIYDNFFEINRFELIFDSLLDKDEEWENHCKKMGDVVYADDDEVFDNDGQEVEVQI